MKNNIFKATLLAIGVNLLVWTWMIVISEAGSMSVAHTSIPPASSHPPSPSPTAPAGHEINDSFKRYLSTDIPPADGFDFPVGDADGRGEYVDKKTGKAHNGWYVSTRFAEWYSYGIHPAEDWNGVGGRNTDLGQPVFAVAAGEVVFADDCGQPSGGVVMIQHVYFENHERHRVRSVYVHLGELKVEKGQIVRRRQQIGTIGKDPKGRFYAHLHFEMRLNEKISPTYWPSAAKKTVAWVRKNYLEPSAFIRAHRHLFVPGKEESLVLIDSSSSRMLLIASGHPARKFPVGFGRGSHDKQVVRRGMYFVVNKKKFELENRYLHFEGGHTLTLNYPNKYDAWQKLEDGSIPSTTAAEIEWAWQQRKKTVRAPFEDKIEIGTWQKSDNRFPSQLPPGKIVLHEHDIRSAFELVAPGTMVIIF